MSDLTDFLLERIAEDEAAARAAISGAGRLFPRGDATRHTWGDLDALGLTWGEYNHAARWDPARALAECQAKRRVVDEHSGMEAATGEYCPAEDGRYLREECPTLTALAGVYSAHSDYRDEWRYRP